MKTKEKILFMLFILLGIIGIIVSIVTLTPELIVLSEILLIFCVFWAKGIKRG